MPSAINTDDYSYTEEELAAVIAETDAEWFGFTEAVGYIANYAKIAKAKSHCANAVMIADFERFQDAAESHLLRNLTMHRRAASSNNMHVRK